MKRYSAAVIGILLIAAAALAQSDQDLIGTWKMDAPRSKFVGSSGAPALVMIKYERAGDLLRETLNVTNAGGLNMSMTIDYALDGRKLTSGTGEDRVTSKLVRKDGALILQSTDDGGVLTRTVSVSADRRTLTIATHDSNPDVKADDLIVFQRQ